MDGEITDGEINKCLFGYDADVRRKLFEFQEKESAVCLSNCAVRRARNGSDLEEFLGKTTSIRQNIRCFQHE